MGVHRGAEPVGVRDSLGGTPLLRDAPLAGAVLLLALVVGASTLQAGWVADSDFLPGLTLTAAVAGCLVARSRLDGVAALALAVAPAPLAAYAAVSASPRMSGRPLGLSLLAAWVHELASGRAGGDPSLPLLFLAALFWLLGTWLAWGVLRRHQPLLATAPLGAVLATNVLNFPDGQDASVFGFLVLTLGMLLWSTYQGSLAAARRRRLKLSQGARWDFWERGALATALLIAVGVMAPPLSVTDRTLDIENGISNTWGSVHRTGHSGFGSSSSIGFTQDVPLGGPLIRTGGVVFTYTIEGDAPGPSYFRGLNLEPANGEWRYVSDSPVSMLVGAQHPFGYAENYQELRRAVYDVNMVRPLATEPNLVVYPGQLASLNLSAVAVQAETTAQTRPAELDTVDRVIGASLPGGRLTGPYRAGVDQSVAPEDELRASGASYPPWVERYRDLPGGYGYRSITTEQQVRDLALQVTAGATNPYDQAVAIESYLRSNYTYTLSPPAPPPSSDPESYFLFNSHRGYCQYFATAMADMLRSLRVPTRLVNGYGPGTYEDKQHRFVVKESDAHTWPEVYFPGYGWIPFEPTPDGVYLPIPRGGGGGISCTGDSCTDVGPGATGVAPVPGGGRQGLDQGGAGSGASGRRWLPSLPPLRNWTPVAAALLLVLVLVGIAVSRYLQPQTVAAVWRRTAWLTRLAGIRAGPGETPIEFSDRVAGAFPEAAAGIRQLAVDFAVAAYAPRDLAEARKPAVLAGWDSLRPLLLRRAASRLLPSRR